MKKLGIVLILAAALMVRVYRLEESSHFLSDESRDLVNMHQIWVEKKLTLAGPISDDGSHMFSSLTYYLLNYPTLCNNLRQSDFRSGSIFFALFF